jgi:hypothetical protein
MIGWVSERDGRAIPIQENRLGALCDLMLESHPRTLLFSQRLPPPLDEGRPADHELGEPINPNSPPP